MSRSHRRSPPWSRADESGQAMLTLLVAATLVTVISVSLVGLMNTDMSRAALQYAVSRSYYIAQAGLEEAAAHVFAAADPSADTTPAEGVTAPYGGGQFTYWVDAGPAAGCGDGLKTLEALGQVEALGRVIPARVRACAVPGVPFLAALFGVSTVEFQRAAQTYLAPYGAGTPGGGGNLGSFTEVNFADNGVRLNALSEDATNLVTLRDGTFADYMLFGFSTRPDYTPTPADDPTPWILGAVGDLLKAQPATGTIPNPCGTPYACVTVGNQITDVPGVADLREADDLPHVYVKRLRQVAVPPLAFDPATFRALAAQNTANAELNRIVGLGKKTDSLYERMQFYRLMFYLAAHPDRFLRGPVYVVGTIALLTNWNMGGNSGDVTLAVEGDLIINRERALMNIHDLSTVAGRRLPGIVVFGASELLKIPTEVCGDQYVNGSGRLVLCKGSMLTVDGLVYTRDGMTIEPRSYVDQIGAMYHDNRGTSNPSFSIQDATLVLRFDPQALSVFGRGIAVLSWQQIH